MFFQLNCPQEPHHSQSPILGEGIVCEEIKPYHKGRVRFKATSWDARCDQELTLAPGTPVRVVKKENITLFVIPAES